MKFGDLLIKEGAITQEQLNAVLERQVIFGGRLGTNIVELGLLREDELTNYLSRYLKIKAVDKKELDDIPEEALESIPKETVLQYNVIPYKKEKKRLYVATFDAMKIEIMDELRFKTGFDVVPHVVSEIRFMYALEKHYGIKRDLRFISVIDDMQEEEAINEVFSTPSTSEAVLEPSEMETTTEPEKREEVKVSAQAVEKKEVKTEKAKVIEEARVDVRAGKVRDVSQVKHSLVDIKDKDEIAQILISEGARVATRRAIFVVKGNRAEGWIGDNINIDGFVANIDPTSIFSQVINNKNFYRGPMPQTPGNDVFSSILGALPQDCVIIPVSIRDRVVSILYADNGSDNVLSGNINYLNSLASLASLSFEILILKKRIMDSNVPAG